ncbi:ShlB/FhaC/HecB family hemolysin secretion/activation protein [Glaesserella parasuis]|uniref:ShlB/FhaC/HecB family hemolysin secretion/activation protein n=1 Tax=Glaesserella parasuis TaxID=738 RepID=UPI002E273D0C
MTCQNGEIELSFVNNPSPAVSGYIGVDNFASRQYHRWQSRFGLNVDSPFGLSDSLYLGGSHTLKSTLEFNRSAILYYSVPYGRWTFNSFGSVSQFRRQIPLVYHNVEQKGRTWQAGVEVDYVAHRGANHISTISAQVEHLNSKSRFEDSVIELQSPKSSVAQFSFNHLQLLSQGSLIFNLDYRRGLAWWNAIKNQGRDQPEGQFQKWSGDVQLSYFHLLGSQKFRQSHRLFGQYSSNYLPATEQADLLGRYAVRGFQDLSLSAEKSLVMQNTLSWLNNYRSLQIEPYALFDLGVQKNSSDNAHSQRAFGYGAGLQLAKTTWKSDIQWVKGKMQREKTQMWEKEQRRQINRSGGRGKRKSTRWSCCRQYASGENPYPFYRQSCHT